MAKTALPKITEAEFRDQVVQFAKLRGCRVCYVGGAFTAKGFRTPWRYDGKGFPDLIIVHPRRCQLIIVELKRDGEVPSPEQQAWLDTLVDIDAYVSVWHPSDWPEIERVLA